MRRKTPKPDSTFDDSVWLDLFEPLFFAEDKSVAERAAKLFHDLLAELENGPKGITNAGDLYRECAPAHLSFHQDGQGVHDPFPGFTWQRLST